MAWIINHKSWVYVITIPLIIFAVLGPWGYSRDGVPPAEWCRPPFILLENNNCVEQVPGFFMLFVYMITFPAGIMQFLTGELLLSDLWRYSLFAILFLSLFVLPFISLLLQVQSGSHMKRRIFYFISWGLAAVLGLFVGFSAEEFHPAHLWGVWFYCLLAVGLLAFEILVIRVEKIYRSRL